MSLKLLNCERERKQTMTDVPCAGIEKEYEQKVIPDGKVNIDGFLCLFDVSVVPSRSIEKQVEIVAAVLNNLIKTKKPVILVTTKNDDANEAYVKEAERLVARKEYKGAIMMVETSAHENINVDLAFIALAQMIDRSKGRAKIVPFLEAARARKEALDQATGVFQGLIRAQVTDYRALWSHASKMLAQHPEFVHFVDQFGIDTAQRLFRWHVKKLKDEHLQKRVQGYMDLLPEVLQEMVPDLNTLQDRYVDYEKLPRRRRRRFKPASFQEKGFIVSCESGCMLSSL